MASDFYCFTAKVGNLHIEAQYCDYVSPNFLSRLRITGKDGEPIKVSGKINRWLRRLINKKLIKLTYTGGWCPNGDSWGPEVTFRYAYDQPGVRNVLSV